MADVPGGNGRMPWWAEVVARHGIMAIFVAYLLGMFDALPGIKSPVTRLVDSFDRGFAAIAAVVNQHHLDMMKRMDAQDTLSQQSMNQSIAIQKEVLRWQQATCRALGERCRFGPGGD